MDLDIGSSQNSHSLRKKSVHIPHPDIESFWELVVIVDLWNEYTLRCNLQGPDTSSG